ncbi:type II and III secretion system protein family protein [Pseudoduganella sp. GCM10020061]|uniref:type II and III secretion system protein family protein n=1 Tax=Pseudoduganella sp. GCM10020061 TaxID=3317345 RepID=UPI0036254250
MKLIPRLLAASALTLCLPQVQAEAPAPAPAAGPAAAQAGASPAARGKPDKRTAGQQARLDTGPRCSGISPAPLRLPLQLGKSTLMRLPESAVNRSVGNPQVVQAMLVSPDTMYVVGVDIGTTNMIVQGRSGACTVVDIVVGLDASALQSALAQAMPDEKNIHVAAAADSVVLTGTVADGAAVLRATELATAFVRRPTMSLLSRNDADAPDTRLQQTRENASVRVINLLNVEAPQQVMLEVKIAEVSKSLMERMETGTTFHMDSGSWAATLLSNFLSGKTQSLLDATKTNGNRITAGAQKQDALVRMLAEPNLLALSGQEGSFLAGGSILIPVAQENNKVSLEEKEFGVGLRFLPTVLAGGRINLRVSPEVSEISREGLGITALNVAGNSILPLITRRRASTTIQLMDGQSFAIGGLLKNNLVNNFRGLPGLGEVPILGALFRSVDYQQDKSELVFVVTARLVKPLVGPVPLPTDAVPTPNRVDVLLGGKFNNLQGPPAPGGAAVPATSTTPGGFETR